MVKRWCIQYRIFSKVTRKEYQFRTETTSYQLRFKYVNIFPCGVVLNIEAPWLAASPDRKVYDPGRAPPLGLLEAKCLEILSVLEVPHLKKNAVSELNRNRNH
jgi:hypothetical protein